MINFLVPAYTVAERRTLLEEAIKLQHDLGQLRQQIDRDGVDPNLLGAEDRMVASLLSSRQIYAAKTPVVPLSRCPYTGLEVHYPIDTLGLDGLWWDLDDPVRPKRKLPPTVFALTGAIATSTEIEFAEHIVSPGPGAPYVIPRLLADDGTAAVLSSLMIGSHQAYAIVYFGFPAHPDRPAVNEWGRREWLNETADPARWEAVPLMIEDCDFILQPWLEEERLLWIPPEDDSLSLHIGVKECPFLDAGGTQKLLHIYRGRLS